LNARTLAIARAAAIIGGTGALVLGATWATTTTNAVTVAGTVQTSKNLKISDNAVNGFTDALSSGYDFDVNPGVVTVPHKHVFVKSTANTNPVLAAKTTVTGTDLVTNKSHITAHFKRAANVVDVPLTTLTTSDQSLSALGVFANGVATDLEYWYTADATTPEFPSVNGDVTLTLTGTDNGTVAP
jgi:hypothetical protein